MKKLILSSLTVLVFGIASAQTEKGSWLIGASSDLGFSSTKVKGADDSQSNFNISPMAGYFIMDNLVFGLDVDFQSSKFGDLKNSSTGIGPFVRYYVNGSFFLGAGYSATSSKIDDGTTDATVSGGLLAFEAGYPIWIVDNVAIEPSLNYGIGSGDALEDTSIFSLAVGFSLYF